MKRILYTLRQLGLYRGSGRTGLVQDSLNLRLVEVVRELRYEGRRRRVWDDGPGGWEEVTVPSRTDLVAQMMSMRAYMPSIMLLAMSFRTYFPLTTIAHAILSSYWKANEGPGSTCSLYNLMRPIEELRA